MKRLMKWFACLYPAAWRERYQSEFEALLDDVSPSWQTSVDILKGAVGMQLRFLRAGKVIAVTGLIGLLAGAVLWLATAKRFSSEAIIKIHSPKAGEEVTASQLSPLIARMLSRSALKEIVEKDKIYAAERAKTPLEDVIDEMRENILVTPVTSVKDSRSGIRVGFSYEDAATAQRVTDDLVAKLMESGFEAAHNNADAPPMDLQLLKAPTLPTVPSSPRLLGLAITGLGIGLCAGVLLALMQRFGKIPAVGGLAGLLIGLCAWLVIPNQFQSRAVLAVRSTHEAGPIEPALLRVLSDETFREIATKYKLYSATPSEDAIHELKNGIRITPVAAPGDTARVFLIQFQYKDRRVAQQVVEDLAARFVSSAGPSHFEVVDPPSRASQPILPRLGPLTLVGLGGGLVVGFVLLFFQRKRPSNFDPLQPISANS